MNKFFPTPVLFLIFNRPDTAERVFDEIKKIQPKNLFIASDGPRINKRGERELVERTRNLVLKNIDWNCEVKTLFRKKNLGCKIAVSGAIDWFFDQVEEGIILEDDCLPSQSFFYFCRELLEKYRNNPLVNAIGGRNRFGENRSLGADYFFSKYNRIWGWATWRRAWQGYDPKISNWPQIKKGKKAKFFFDSYFERKHFENIWNKCFAGKIDTWDYQWFLHRLLIGGYTAVPKRNLIRNIGLGHALGTHTSSAESDSCAISEISFPLMHPKKVEVDEYRDEKMRKVRMSSLGTRIKSAMKNIKF